ncbi:MAG: hypothetical protein RBU25_09915 [Lentisphaeria bacterium]|jgi:phosphotransferase system HPr-like phosphotransfer protein|nr:hypothetical protein [Lentisphaeria bacterium]
MQDAKGKHRPKHSRRIIGDDEFTQIFAPHVSLLLELAHFAMDHPERPANRPFLNSVYARTNRAIEVLDSCGARGNRRWYPFRVRLAALRNLSLAAHEMLHVYHSAPDYCLLEVEGDFAADTKRAVAYLDRVVRCVLGRTLTDALGVGLPPPAEGTIDPTRFVEDLPPGRLAHDREERHDQSAGERIVALATRYLEVDAESRVLSVVLGDERPWQELIPDPLSEESLRQIMVSFHNLQSEYDTYISDSDVEAVDSDLVALRGHASLALHLTRIASTLAHFYERHMIGNNEALFCCRDCLLYEDTFRWVLFDYCVAYARRYSQAAVPVAHRILRDYAEIAEIQVPVPRYHGFHVRPSTYVSQIIRHYGSEASMELAGSTYNPGSIFDLFRANEAIQKTKREQICDLVAAENTDHALAADSTPETEVRRVLLSLAVERKIVIHEELVFDKLKLSHDRRLFDLVADAVFHFLRTGRIDVETNLVATFRGDKRVLHDIQLLAENGYGEDERGRNLPMPPGLEYLKHSM